MDFKRGISAKDLRPFSVEDPDGTARQRQEAPPVWGGATETKARTLATGSTVTVTPEQARKWARLGCFLPMILLWAIGLFVGIGSSIPHLFEAARPAIESLVARLVQEFEKTDQGSSPSDAAPTPIDSGAPSSDSAVPSEPAPGDVAPPDTAASAPADPQTELHRVCERTVECCLTVQGERARSICENFRRMPVVEPCQQSFEVFAQVGRQTGRICKE